ncbi:MAG: DUF1761 family protein [Elusimicrobiota bacterium]
MMNYFQIFFGGFIASLAWFLAGSALYLNPLVARIYKNAENSPGLKRWSNIPKYIALQYVGIAVQCLLWAFVFALVKPALPEKLMIRGLLFGLILLLLKIVPRFIDMWIQSTYPNKLLFVEFVNGTIGSFIIGVALAYTI